MYNLDHRLAELRPSEDELRVARERRDAAETAARQSVAAATARTRHAGVVGTRPTRVAAG